MGLFNIIMWICYYFYAMYIFEAVISLLPLFSLQQLQTSIFLVFPITVCMLRICLNLLLPFMPIDIYNGYSVAKFVTNFILSNNLFSLFQSRPRCLTMMMTTWWRMRTMISSTQKTPTVNQ